MKISEPLNARSCICRDLKTKRHGSTSPRFVQVVDISSLCTLNSNLTYPRTDLQACFRNGVADNVPLCPACFGHGDRAHEHTCTSKFWQLVHRRARTPPPDSMKSHRANILLSNLQPLAKRGHTVQPPCSLQQDVSRAGRPTSRRFLQFSTPDR